MDLFDLGGSGSSAVWIVLSIVPVVFLLLGFWLLPSPPRPKEFMGKAAAEIASSSAELKPMVHRRRVRWRVTWSSRRSPFQT
jgi:hypothetical protein